MWNVFGRLGRSVRNWLSPQRVEGGEDDTTPLPLIEDLRCDVVSKLGGSTAAELAAELPRDSLETLLKHFDDHIQRRERVSATWWRDGVLTVESLLVGPVEDVLHYKPKPEHVSALRRSPQRLRAIVDRGLSQLLALEDVALWAELTPPGAPVAVWLEAMCAAVRGREHKEGSAQVTVAEASAVDDDDDFGASMLHILSKFDVSAVCGHYFTENETGVHCLECTADTTCVMCMTCFRTSPCRFHRYRLTSTTSGGMCDCGNPHMWKPESFCRHHGAHATSSNPVDSLPEAHREWIAETIRGLMHFLAILLQVGLSFRQAPWTTPELIIGGPTLGTSNWMIVWLALASEQLQAASLCGDGARRLLTIAWTSVAHIIEHPFYTQQNFGFCSAKEDLTCLEILFLFDLSVNGDDSGVSRLRRLDCYQDVIKCVANCLPDSAFRMPYAIHLCQYAETISNSDELGNLCVQVLNRVAVNTLTERKIGIPSLNITDTIVHRMMSAILYLLTTLVDCDQSGFDQIPGGDWMVRLVRSEVLSTLTLTFFSMCLGCSHEAAVATILSRTCFKAFCALLLLIQCNSDIYKDPSSSGSTSVVSIPHWLGRAIVSELWRMQLNVREVLAALTDAHDDRIVACEFLDIQRSVVDTLSASVSLADPHLSLPYTKVLFHCRVRSGQMPLTWDTVDPTTADSAFVFAADLLNELHDHLAIFLHVQRLQFCKANMTVVLSPKKGTTSPSPAVYDYDLLRSEHAVSTSNTVITLMSFVLRAWMMELGRRNGYCWSQSDRFTAAVRNTVRLHGTTQESQTASAAAQAVLESSEANTTLLGLMRRVCQRSDDTRVMLGGLLDALVMPLVLVSQVEQGLWRRNEHDVAVDTQTYLLSGTKCFLEGDIFFLQVLSAFFPPADFTLRILQRFTYSMMEDSDSSGRDSEDDDARQTILGYARYLRLVLTIVHDTSKNCNYTEFSQPAIDRTVANLLSGSRMPHSLVLQYVNNRIPGDFEGETIRGAPQNGTVEKMVRQALDALAVGEQTQAGLQFRLKSTAVWRQHVDLYYPMATDDTMPAMYEQYRSIETLEYLQAIGDEQRLIDDTSSAETLDGPAAARVVQVPPTVLRSSQQYAQLVPPTRALLHSDALLLPCIFVLHLFNDNVKRRLRGECDPFRVSEPLLVHAVTALHLCVQDCEELTAALNSEQSFKASSHAQRDGTDTTVADSSSSEATTETPIDWPRVEAYLLEKVQQSGTLEAAESCSCLPLPFLAGEKGLRHKLQIPISSLQMPQSSLTLFETPKDAEPLTTVNVLHEIRGRYLSSTELDRFSVVKMIDHVLLATDLARFRPLDENAKTCEEARRRQEEASRRQKRLKDRQSKLLERMRLRCAKTTASASPSSAAAGSEEAAQLLRPLRPHESGYLHTKLLMDLATFECCVCRLTGTEPLMMLAHTSTSGSLFHLRHDTPGLLVNERTAHGHFYTCGHTAHMTCIEKVYSRLAKQWSDGIFFEGRYYLGPSELLCPMCMMICNTVCVCPTLTPAAASGSASASPTMTSAVAASGVSALALPAPDQPIVRDAGSGNSPPSPPSPPPNHAVNPSGETLFEELRRCSVSPHSAFYQQLTTRCDALIATVAAANIGLNISESTSPLVIREDSLQSTNPRAWELAETIRCAVVALRLAVELTLVGQGPTRKDMITILALLTSIYPTRVETSYAAIQTRFLESGEGMCLLVLECLRSPRQAAQSIQRYTTDVVQSNSDLRSAVEKWLNDAGVPVTPPWATVTSDERPLPPASAQDQQHDHLMCLLRELLAVGYLKLLLVEEPAHLVLKAEEEKCSDVVAFVALETAEAREDTLLRHLAYLLRVKVAPEMVASLAERGVRTEIWRAVCQEPSLIPQAATPPPFAVPQLIAFATPYASPGEWAKHILSTILHQEAHYTQILTDYAKTGVCSECGKASRKPVLCCLCHRYFCLQPTDSAPELYAHTRSCCGGLGLYLVVRGTYFIFVDTVATRIGEYRPIYTDEFGEADLNLARGAPLSRNDEDGLQLLLVWIANRWGVESRIVKHSYAGSVVMSV